MNKIKITPKDLISITTGEPCTKDLKIGNSHYDVVITMDDCIDTHRNKCEFEEGDKKWLE